MHILTMNILEMGHRLNIGKTSALSLACPEFLSSRRVFNTIQIVRFTSLPQPALTPRARTNNIQDFDVDP